MKNKILFTFVLLISFGTIVSAQTSTSTSTTVKLKGLNNAVLRANENSNVACVRFVKHLKYGDGLRTGKQSEVKDLQEALREKGYFNYPESTGYFGTVTKDAVKKYQKNNGIISTGNVFNLTIGQLQKDFCQKNNNNNKNDKYDLINNPVTSDCKAWFDGCNNCFRSETGGIAGCTLMYCPNNNLQKPYCKEYFATSTKNQITSDCKAWFDGCNNCSRETVGGEAVCTLMFCPDEAMQKPYCKEYFKDASSPIKDCPSEKIINLMPRVCPDSGCENINNAYYIYNGTRKEISDFDKDYISRNCTIKETKVY